MRYFRYIMLISLLMLPTGAKALSVGNCDETAHKISIDFFGEVKHYTLEPGEWHRVYGAARSLSLGSQEISLSHHNNRYCIWGGKISLQSRQLHLRGK